MNKLIFLTLLFSPIFLLSQISIKMRNENGINYIPCKINNLELEFIFDTGASDVSLSLDLAIFMLKKGYLSKYDLGETVYYSIANGDISEGTNVNLREIEIAGIKLFNVDASIVHTSKAPLLLGNSVINRLGTISLNKNILTIHSYSSNSYSSNSYSSKDEPTRIYSEKEIKKIRKDAKQELTAANTALENKNYALAGDKFINVYNLVEALGTKDDLYKYQAAISYYNANNFNKALTIIKNLAANNFTGVSATQPTNYNKDLYILGLNSLYNLKQYDTLLDEALAKYPKDIDINSIASSIYQITGNTDKLKTKIEENIKINPTDYLNYYNLGVLLMDDPAQEEKSRELFKKSIELNPKHVESYRNLTSNYLKKDKVYVENINNNLGNSKQEKAIYNENLAKRKELFKEVIPYLEKIHELEPNDIAIVKNLIVANRTLENRVKEGLYRALEKKLMGK